MAEVTIKLRFNRHTGRRELIVAFEGESDALPHEHERDHRPLVEALIGKPILEDTDVIVRRSLKDGTVTDSPEDPAPAARAPVATKGGGGP